MAALNREKFALVILGPQGSGKGTQAQILAEKLGCERFEMGAQLRAAKEKSDDFGKQVGEIIDRGDYVPDRIIKKVLNEYFASNHHDRMVFDGVPRTLQQSDVFDQVLNEHGFPKPWVIHLNLSKATTLKRLLARGRDDDTVEIINQRLKNHEQLTGPVIEKYRVAGQIIEIDGEPPVEEVIKMIFEALEQKGITV